MVKHLTQIIMPKSLYGNAISTARTRALPGTVTSGKINEVMQEIYNDLRTQRKLPTKQQANNEVSLAAPSTTGKNCWSCGITSSGIAPSEGMRAAELAVVDPAEVDPRMAVADVLEPVEAIADVVERAVAVMDAADFAKASRTARTNKAVDTTAAQCRIYAATTVV